MRCARAALSLCSPGGMSPSRSLFPLCTHMVAIACRKCEHFSTSLSSASVTLRGGRAAPADRSVVGRVSRAQLVHTTARNCVGDEGGPFGIGNHGLISSHCKLLWSKSHGGERCSQVRAACPDR